MRMRVARIVAVAALAVLVAGCSLVSTPPDNRVNLAVDDLIGTWTHGTRNSLEFTSDGSFTAVGLPARILADSANFLPAPPTSVASIDAKGTFDLGPSREDRAGPHNHISLVTTEIMQKSVKIGLEMTAEHSGSAIVLTFYLGDPDVNNRYSYSKCAITC